MLFGCNDGQRSAKSGHTPVLNEHLLVISGQLSGYSGCEEGRARWSSTHASPRKGVRGRVSKHLRVYSAMQRVRVAWLPPCMEQILAFHESFLHDNSLTPPPSPGHIAMVGGDSRQATSVSKPSTEYLGAETLPSCDGTVDTFVREHQAELLNFFRVRVTRPQD